MFPRFVHIVKSNGGHHEDQRYTIHDANRFGSEESGFTQPLPRLSRQEASGWLASEGVPQAEIDSVLHKVDEEGEGSVPLKPRIGPRIVRAWFDTVINPLIESLEMELTLVRKGNWTWRFRPPSLELIRPARRYLEHFAVANLEQICHLDSETKAAIEKHDRTVEVASDGASALHRAVATDPAFVRLCNTLWDPQALAAAGIQDVREIFGAYEPENGYDLIAQNIVNGTGALPRYYATSKFWNRHRETLMGTLAQPEVQPYHESLLQAGRSLEEAIQELLQRLRDRRLELSLDYDVPYVVGGPAVAVL